MKQSIEPFRLLSPRDIGTYLHPDDIREVVRNGVEYTELFQIAAARFRVSAKMENDDNKRPFVRWADVNTKPERWVPAALGKLVNAMLDRNPVNQEVAVIGIPASATWIGKQFEEEHLIAGARYPRVLKKHQMEEWGISSDGWMELPVHSYVHNRKRDGTRGIQPVYILDQHLFEGAFVVLVDDAMAEGRSILDTAEGMLGLGASGVGVAVPMAKRMQGGWEALKMHPAIDWQVTMVLVEATHGKDGGMDICNDYNELVCKNPY